MRLHDFVQHQHARTGELEEAEIVALRLYTTSVYQQINSPLRDQARISSGEAHRMPVTVTLIARGVKKLRAVDADARQALQSLVLWRGMKNIRPTDDFAASGGTELAPMSTTSDIATAVAYSISSHSLIFKIVTRNKLQRGADLQWLSAVPSEAEILYPPLTYLQPTGRTQVLQLDRYRFTVVEVMPTLA